MGGEGWSRLCPADCGLCAPRHELAYLRLHHFAVTLAILRPGCLCWCAREEALPRVRLRLHHQHEEWRYRCLSVLVHLLFLFLNARDWVTYETERLRKLGGLRTARDGPLGPVWRESLLHDDKNTPIVRWNICARDPYTY